MEDESGSAIEIVARDVPRLILALSGSVRKVGLFGSSLRLPLSVVSDVDVAIYVEGPVDMASIRSALVRAELTLPVRVRKINGVYGRASPEDRASGLHYHFVVLEAENPNPEFEQRNAGRIDIVFSR